MTLVTNAHALAPAFADPVHESQTVFRNLLEAMAHPGWIFGIETTAEAPAPMKPAMTALALSLFDGDTAIWLDTTLAERACVADYLRFHCGCPIVQRLADADFALIGDGPAMPRLDRFAQGDPRYPERSATILVELPRLTGGRATVLTGPGIADTRDFDPVGLPDWFWDAWRVNRTGFPLGVDIVFTSGDELCALPRSTHAEA